MASEWEACARAIEFCVYKCMSFCVKLLHFIVVTFFVFSVYLLILRIIVRHSHSHTYMPCLLGHLTMGLLTCVLTHINDVVANKFWKVICGEL